MLSLFAGIGGLELGLERAGMTVVGQVELDEFCRSILTRHWPEVPKHDDVTTAVGWWTGQPRPRVDVVCGGFPCQPFSTAGLRRGVGDPRWLWPAMADVVRAVRPRYVVVENVAALLRDVEAFGWLLGDLAELGFDAEWSVLPACSLGAPHTRERLFLVAYPDGGDGFTRLGLREARPRSVPELGYRQGAWGDRIDRAVAASRSDDRETDGSARWMVKAGGNAVVPQVAELVGRLMVDHAAVAA